MLPVEEYQAEQQGAASTPSLFTFLKARTQFCDVDITSSIVYRSRETAAKWSGS